MFYLDGFICRYCTEQGSRGVNGKLHNWRQMGTEMFNEFYSNLNKYMLNELTYNIFINKYMFNELYSRVFIPLLLAFIGFGGKMKKKGNRTKGRGKGRTKGKGLTGK